MTSAPLYRAPWFMTLASLSRGTGWTAHEAARSVLAESGAPRLSRTLLPLALASVPPKLHKLVVGALLTVGLWVETPEGYELRAAPAAERSTPEALAKEEARRDAERAKAAQRKANQRKREREAKVATEGRDQGRDTPSSHAVTPPVTDGVTAPLSRRDIDNSLSSSLEENSSSQSLESEQAGGAGGAPSVTPSVTPPPPVTAPVTPKVTPRDNPPAVTPPVPAAPPSAPTFAPEPGTGPLSAPPPAPPPTAAPAAPKPRKRNPRPEMRPEVAEVFTYWISKGLMPNAEPIRQRVEAVEARLRGGRSVAEIKLAIDGCAKSGWHIERAQVDLTQICDPTKFDRFLAWGKGSATPSAPVSSRSGTPAAPQPVSPGPANPRWKPAFDSRDYTLDSQGRIVNKHTGEVLEEAAQ